MISLIILLLRMARSRLMPLVMSLVGSVCNLGHLILFEMVMVMVMVMGLQRLWNTAVVSPH